MASNAKDHLLAQIRKKAKETYGYDYDDFEEIEEQIYIPVQKEEWDEVLENLESIEERHEFDLGEQKDFVKEMENPDRLQTVDDDTVDGSGSQQEKLLIKRQIENADGEEILATTDESISSESLYNMSEDYYNSFGKKTFIISKQQKWDGRVAVELGATKEKFELLSVYEDKDGNNYFKHFGQKNPNKGYNLKEKMTEGFYKYKFICDDEEYIALSREKLDTVRCKMYGTKISLNDYDPVGEVLKLSVDKDIIFVHSVDPAIEVMSQDELDLYRTDLSHDDLATSLLGDWRQPEWFEKMLLADIFVNDENGFPSHLIWTGPPGTGKSKAVEAGVKALDEAQKEPFTGSGSTIKGLVPSFKENPPEEGYLLKTQRMAGVDEKMDLLSNTVQQSNEHQSDVFRPLLNLLTHDTRNFESGNGSIKGEMASVMWSAGNMDAYGIQDMQDLAEKIDDAYLSRCIVYNQTDSHIAFIDDRKADIKNKMQQEGLNEDDLMPQPDDKFISLVDTMRETNAITDYNKIQEIRKELKSLVPGYMKEKYRARYEHHMTNIVAGIAKYRYLIDNRDSFEAQDEDYEEMKEIFETVISSWGDVNLKELSETARKRALTPPQRRVLRCVEEEPGLTAAQVADKVDVESFSWCLKSLEDAELIVGVERPDGEQTLHPHWTEEAEEYLEEYE